MKCVGEKSRNSPRSASDLATELSGPNAAISFSASRTYSSVSGESLYGGRDGISGIPVGETN